MEETEERKKRFTVLLNGLLEDCCGIKGELANKLNIHPSTLTPWLQGKQDPANLDVTSFIYLAKLKNISVNELAVLLGVSINRSELSLENKFKSLIEQLLLNKSQQELAKRLGVTRNTISSWIIPSREIDPTKINIATMSAIAFENGWTLERLFIYLGFKDLKNSEDLRFKLKSITTTLSLPEQIDLLAWLSSIVSRTVKDSAIILNRIQNNSDRSFLIILEKEDLKLASRYSSNLVLHIRLNPNNIEVVTILALPESLENFDLLIFNLENKDSPIIEVINKISFDGDIVILTAKDLETEVRSQLGDKVTDIVAKPIDWQELKNKSYF